MENEAYWQKRATERLVESEQIAQRAEVEMQKAFEAAYKDIEAEIYKLYGKYATDNEMDYSQALIYLSNDAREDFQRDLAFYLEKAQDAGYREEHRAYLQALSTRARVKRLEEYQAHLKMIAEQLYQDTLIPLAEGAMAKIINDSYLKSAFDLSQASGILLNFSQPTPKLVDTILEYPWSGKNFDQKWNDNCRNFGEVLDETLTKGLVNGASNQEIARELAAKTKASYDRAMRLVRTETNNAHNEAGAALAQSLGIEKYKFLATLDHKTSSICRSLDLKTFAYKDKVEGENFPPMHPHCRSAHFAVIYEDEIGTRSARDKDGKEIKVPDNMTYEEWHKKYVESDPEYQRKEQMYKNRHADKKRYEKYAETLKDTGMIKSLDEFLAMKYNNPKAWKALQGQYRLENARYKGYQYNKDGTIRVTDDHKGERFSAPRAYKPFAVIETSSHYKSGYRQIDRSYYDENGVFFKQVHSGHHNRPEAHQFGTQGEHSHEYKWGKNGEAEPRNILELTDRERAENKDILTASHNKKKGA